MDTIVGVIAAKATLELAHRAIVSEHRQWTLLSGSKCKMCQALTSFEAKAFPWVRGSLRQCSIFESTLPRRMRIANRNLRDGSFDSEQRMRVGGERECQW